MLSLWQALPVLVAFSSAPLGPEDQGGFRFPPLDPLDSCIPLKTTRGMAPGPLWVRDDFVNRRSVEVGTFLKNPSNDTRQKDSFRSLSRPPAGESRRSFTLDNPKQANGTLSGARAMSSSSFIPSVALAKLNQPFACCLSRAAVIQRTIPVPARWAIHESPLRGRRPAAITSGSRGPQAPGWGGGKRVQRA